MQKVLIFGLALATANAATAQPFSQSMAQCAGLYEGVLGGVQTPEKRAKVEHAATAFTDAALAEARAEGREDPEGWVTGHREAMRADWAGRGLKAVLSEDFRDWTAYCRAFAKDRGIDFKLE